MGLVQAYAIYLYGKKRGKEVYREACKYAEIQARESEARLAAASRASRACSLCGHRYAQHSDSGACPSYDE